MVDERQEWKSYIERTTDPKMRAVRLRTLLAVLCAGVPRDELEIADIRRQLEALDAAPRN